MDLTTPIPIPGDLELEPAKATIVTVLHRRAILHPEKRAFVFLANGEDEAGALTYGELDIAARSTAARLTTAGLKGSNVLMFYPPGLEFIIAFFGCLYAGVIPAAVYPPRKNRSQSRIRTIASDCSASAILTTESIARSMERNFSDDPLLSGLKWYETDRWVAPGEQAPSADPAGTQQEAGAAAPFGTKTDPGSLSAEEPDFEALAFLQYTSGSTGDPKGVMVSHRNIMYNLRSLQIIFSIVPEDTAVHWVPQFHDLGLIFGILETVFSGSTTIQIPPFVFVSNPFTLLNAITNYRATVSGQPDFAFNHCVERIDELNRSRLDLSTLRVMYSGAEPVRKPTLDRFRAAFEPAGLRCESLIPAYGMAESTLILTGLKPWSPTVYLPVVSSAVEKNLLIPASTENDADDIRWIASNGRTTMDTSLLIVDPETMDVVQPYRIGEIWASGSTITMGYYNKPGLTSEVYRQSPAGQKNPVWLRTGDLGFLYNDELYITGRIKDLIIINGRNYYPQDIEAIAEESHGDVKKTCTAAFSVDRDGREGLAIVAELRRTLLPHNIEGILEALVSAISREFEIQPVRIMLIKNGSIIKTSSGKIMRRANREAMLNGRFEVIADRQYDAVEVSPQGFEGADVMSLGQFLVSWATFRLNHGQPVDPSRDLTVYGIDSIRAVELSEEIKNLFGLEWPPYLFFEEIPISGLVNRGMNLTEEK